METIGKEEITDASESLSLDDARHRSRASNCKGEIGQSAIADVGSGKEDSDCKSGSNPANYAWNVQGAGQLNYNNNKNNYQYFVRAVSVAPATSSAVYDIPFQSLLAAWQDCERNKRNTSSAIRFRWHAARDLVTLWRAIRNGTYKPGVSRTFIINHPVKREIWAASFRDRIVHHWEALRFDPILQQFITDCGDRSFNCRKGYGNLRAIATLVADLWEFTEGGTREDCWIVGGDFANYFMSIDRELLWRKFETLMRERYESEDKETLIYLTRATMMQNCRDNYLRIGDKENWKGLPRRKSLFFMNGLPIGNLPSQLWANFLSAHFMQHIAQMRGTPRGFIQFVDDWRVLVRSKEEGRRLIGHSRQWLWDNLHITLHPNKVYLQHWRKGTKITGAIVKPGRTYVDNRTRAALMRKLEAFRRDYATRMHRGDIREGSLDHWRILCRVRASVNSYLGIMSSHKSYNVRRKVIERHFLPTWGKWFYTDEGMKRVRIRQRYDLRHRLPRLLRRRRFAVEFAGGKGAR